MTFFVFETLPSAKKEAGRPFAKIFLYMKLTIAFVLSAIMVLNASVHSQDITYSGKNVPLVKVLRSIEQQTGYVFFYKTGDLNAIKPVTVSIKQADIGKAMNILLSGLPLQYRIEGNTIALTKAAADHSNRKTTEAAVAPSQPPPVRGTVRDSLGRPIAGASVSVKGTARGTVTDAGGNFVIEAVNGEILMISFIGYEPMEITVSATKTMNIVLRQKTDQLEEQLVVVGYGAVRRKDLTGSVGSANVTDMQKAPVISFEEALSGRVAGVQVTSADGQPGADISVVIRGNNSVTQDNSPLYVIDGFPMENPNTYTLNPQEIESIEILKDASATAIYGARGSNGVVMITTKKGKTGKPKLSYNVYYGLMQMPKRMELMNGYEFVKYQAERDSANAANNYFTEGRTLEDYRNIAGTDLQDEMFRTSAFQNHFISLSGGNPNSTRYAISGSVLNQDGIMINSGYTRYQGRVNIDQAVSSKFKLGINSNYSYARQLGTAPAEQRTGFFYGNLLYSAWAFRPVSARNVSTDPLEEEQGGDLSDEDFLNLMGFNPLKTAQNEYRARITDILTSNLYAEYELSPVLKFRATGGLTKSQTRRESFNNSQTPLGSPLTTAGQNNGVNGSVITNTLNSWLNENTLTYNKAFGKKHSLNVVGGFSMQDTRTASFGAAANLIPNEALGLAGLDQGQPVSVTSLSSRYTLASFLARANYSFASRYLFTASFRADGSSKFSPEHKWSYFPSGAFAWRLSNEPFMKNVNAISDAKIRLSYGTTGNNRVSDFAYLTQIDLPADIGYSYANSPVKAAILSSLGNKNLKWETTSQFNAGLDLSLFDDRVSFTADAYKKVTHDLLLEALTPYTVGFFSAFKNIGKVQNTGLEFTLNTVNIKKEELSWNTSFNISFNRNKVLALTENQTQLFTLANWNIDLRSVPPYVAAIGQPVAMFWGYVWDGNYQYTDFNQNADGTYILKEGVPAYGTNRALVQPGNIKYRDVNGDSAVNTGDRTIIGNPNPKFTGGFTNDLTYKNFDMNLFFDFSYGNDVLNANRIIFEGGGRVNQNMFATYNNRWTPENQNNSYYRTGGGGPSDFGYSTRVIEDGSYLRLRTLALGYTFPASWLSRIKLNNIRVYASAQNLYTFTRYSGFDPEVSAYGSSALRPAFDYSVYPRSRTITLGATINF